MRLLRSGARWTALLRSALLASALLLAGAACDDDSPANRYFHAAEDLNQVTCACGLESRGPCNVSFQEFASCQLEVVRDYEDEIADFLDCAAEHTVAQTRCIKRVGCDEERIDACLDIGIERRCGKLPDPIGDQLDDEIDARCDDDDDGDDDDEDCKGDSCSVDVPASFLCDNGNAISSELFCDGVDDCGDRSDELCSMTTEPAADPGAAAGAGGFPAGTAGAGGASPDPALACVDSTLANGRELVTLDCAQCLCGSSVMETLACGAECWELIRCSMEHCGFPQSETDIPCLQKNCPTLAAGAVIASVLASNASASCRAVCVSIVP